MLKIENLNLKKILVSVNENPKNGKKDISNCVAGWNSSLSIDELNKINNDRINNDIYNQFYIQMNREYLVIDIDHEKSYLKLVQMLKQNNIYNEDAITLSYSGKTKNLYYKRHFWFKIESDRQFKIIKQESQIKFNGGEIFFGHKCIIGEFKNTIIYNIPSIDISIYNDIIEGFSSLDINKLDEKINIEYSDDDNHDDVKYNKNISLTKVLDKNNEISTIFDGLSKIRYDNFNYWLICYYICINEKIDLNLFDYFSKKSIKYNYNENQKILNNIVSKNGYTIATLYFWLKEDNIILFKQLCKTRTDFWDLQLDNHSIAKLYYNMYPTSYIYHYNLGWYEYDKYNVLINRGEKTPLNLINNFASSLQDLAIEHRNNLSNNDEKILSKMKIFINFYKKVGDTTFIEKTIKQLSCFYLIDDLDKKINNKYLLSFKNVLYDYNLNIFRKINKDDYITLTTGYDLILKNNIPVINNDMKNLIKKTIFSLFDDKDIYKFWMYSTAISLFGNVKERFYIHSGKGGGNGKGMTQTILKNCLGDYYKTVSNNFLMGSISKGGADPELVQCVGVRYLSVCEPDDTENKKFNISNLKTFSGNDPISCRGLFKSTFEFLPQFTININCNEIPKMSNMDGGISRRLIIIDYPFSFRDKSLITNHNIHKLIDYSLKEKIIHNQDFIQTFILMLIHKANKYKKMEYKIPNKILSNNEVYKNDNNNINDWFNNNIIKTDNINDIIKAGDLLEHYNNSIDCIKKLRPNEFNKLLEKLQINKIDKRNYKYYTNIKYIDLLENSDF
jgi:P4 family phage/plasmid primase-like protien